MKKCFKCNEVKPIEDFYAHKMMADGHLNKCKECAKSDTALRAISRSDYIKSYERYVTKTQTNAYTYTVPGFVNPKGELQRMWGYYPKASDFVANSDGSFTIKLDDSRAWTLKLIDDLT